MSNLVAILDYGLGNLLSVLNAFQILGAEAFIAAHPEELAKAERIVIPGVGAFKDCMANLRARHFIDALEKFKKSGRPILGICLGLQAMAKRSFEFGEHDGLGWFDADVVKLEPGDRRLRIPHVGWNDISWQSGCPLFLGLPDGSEFYFVHSYQMHCANSGNIAAVCDYGGNVTAAVLNENVFATQFHPEKSQDYGSKVLENFINWKP